jgi:DNA modification methylase
MLEINKIYQENCLNTMAKFSNKSITMLITDPPFNANYGFDNDNLPTEEFYSFCESWILEAERISISQTYIVDPKYALPFYRIPDKTNYHHTYTVFKNNGMRGMKGGFANTTSVIVYHQGNVNKVKEFPNDLWTIPTIPQNVKHPTPKPVKLYDIIILKFTNENDIVYDPFAGSGTIGISAMKFNRKFIGSEINQNFANEANQRIFNERGLFSICT